MQRIIPVSSRPLPAWPVEIQYREAESDIESSPELNSAGDSISMK